jgi:hypothetical protein
MTLSILPSSHLAAVEPEWAQSKGRLSPGKTVCSELREVCREAELTLDKEGATDAG